MKILITGATGLIGRSIINHALENKIKVYYLTRDRSKIKKTKDLEGFHWDLNRNYIDLNCFEGVNSIINLAGEKIFQKWSKKNKKEIFSSRIKAVDLLVKGIKNSNISSLKSFVSASAIGIYGSSLEKEYKESDIDEPKNFVQRIVSEWEQKVLSIHNLIPSVSILRIGLVLTKGGGFLKELSFLTKFGLGIQLGSGKQLQSWIHIDDIARIFLFVANSNLKGIYNAVSPKPVTQNLLLKKIRKNSNRKFIIVSIPAFLLKFIFGERSSLFLESQRVNCNKIIESGFEFLYDNLDETLSSLYKKSDNLT